MHKSSEEALISEHNGRVWPAVTGFFAFEKQIDLYRDTRAIWPKERRVLDAIKDERWPRGQAKGQPSLHFFKPPWPLTTWDTGAFARMLYCVTPSITAQATHISCKENTYMKFTIAQYLMFSLMVVLYIMCSFSFKYHHLWYILSHKHRGNGISCAYGHFHQFTVSKRKASSQL